MGWFGKLTFGTMGLLFGGPLGAIAGAALGHMLLDKKTGYPGRDARSIPGPEFGQAEQAQATYFISLFSILGKMAKIDGVVTRDEMVVVQDFFLLIWPKWLANPVALLPLICRKGCFRN